MVLTLAVAWLLAAEPQTVAVEHLRLDLPAGYVLETKAGPDFAVHYVHRETEAQGQLGIYLGNHPHTVAEGKPQLTDTVHLGRKRVRWAQWETPEVGKKVLSAEIIVEKPFGTEPAYSTHLHLFITAPTLEELSALKAIAATLRPGNAPPR